MYRIVVETGADFSANVGDEAYFAAMVDLFQEHFGDDLQITKFANEPEAIASRYGLQSLYSGRSVKRRLQALGPTLRAIATADLYVWGGGQMPLDSHGVLSVLYRFHRPMLAKLLGTPVMSYAVGAGPLDLPHSRVIVRHCMNAFDLITVRDRFSVSLLKEVGVRRPIHQTVDSAVILEAAPRSRVEAILRDEGVPLDRPIVGMVPWGPAFRRLKSIVPVIFRRKHFRDEDLRRLDAHCAILAGAFDTFIEQHGVFVLFVAMDRSKGHGFDDEVALRTIARMKHRDRAHLLREQYHPKEVKGLLGRCEFVVGSRMHGLILATGEGVPTVGVCFTEKIRDFGRLTAQQGMYVNVRDLACSDDLVQVFERCWANRASSRRLIARVLREFRALVRQNVGRMAHLLTSRHRGRWRQARERRRERQRGRHVRHRVRGMVLNINPVRGRDLCHFCGTCYGVCPRNNIRIGRDWNDRPRFAVRDVTQCVGCGLCWRVCSGRLVDFAAHRQTLFGKSGDSMERLSSVSARDPGMLSPDFRRLGCYERLLATQSTRPDIVARATSGGTVSELTRYLLEERVVDGVVVTRMDCSGPRPRPLTWIATDPAELDQLSGSIYMIAPVNTILRTIKREGRGKRFALVGLGCHVEGLRAAQRVLPWLKERVPLAVGLFCGHGVSPLGTWHLLRRLGVKPERVTSLAYRYGPLPGRFRAVTDRGRVVELPLKDYVYMLSAYGNARCWTCVDPLNELADVSVGDAWLPEYRGRGDWNLTIVRTPAGGEVIDALVARGRLRAEPTTADGISQAQRMQLYLRERGAWARIRLVRTIMGQKIPQYRGIAPMGRLRWKDFLRSFAIIHGQLVAQSPMTQGLMVPLTAVARRLLGRRTRAKDALIGRDRRFRKDFFNGGEYKF